MSTLASTILAPFAIFIEFPLYISEFPVGLSSNFRFHLISTSYRFYNISHNMSESKTHLNTCTSMSTLNTLLTQSWLVPAFVALAVAGRLALSV
jgi:hypothetical protein